MRPLDTSKVFESAKRMKIIESLRIGHFRTVLMLAVLAAGFLLLSSSPPLNKMFSRVGSVNAAVDETIATYASDCVNPQSLNTWNLGGTVCAQASNAPPVDQQGNGYRRIAWVAPNGAIAEIWPDPNGPGPHTFGGSGSDTYTIPMTGDFAQVGTWSVISIDSMGVVFATAEFVVRDSANASADLALGNFGPFQTSAGNSISYRVELTNKGPDDAQSVTLTSPVPGNTTFFSETQDSGPVFTCTAPTQGASSGTISCTIATLPANATAIFTFTFNVDSGVANGTLITSTASVSSNTNELHQPNNSASTSSTVVAETTGCTVTCPSVNSVSTSECSAVVTYGAASTSGNCGSSPEGGSGVVCSPPSGSTFPIGNTTVTCTAISGDSCSFVVTVNYTGPSGGLSINCPSPVIVNSTSVSAGQAIVNYPAPTTNGNCVTVVCTPPSGSPFSLGTTPVTCNASDPANNTATCSFTVTLNNANAECELSCPGDITVSASGSQCNAVVTYSAPTTVGNCGTVTCTPASGSTFSVGSTVVMCTSSAGESCDFNVTVVPASPPTITTCATNKSISCGAGIPNLVSEVVTTGCGVSVSQSPPAGTIVGGGTVTVTITAENLAGEATCTAVVTVSDPTPPVITSCPANRVATDCLVPDVTHDVVASDNCSALGALVVTQSPAAGTPVSLAGTHVITVTVKDEANNATTCTTTFTVDDMTPPVAVCKNITVNLNASGTATITGADVDNGSTDNCGITSRTVSPNSFTCANKGSNTVTLTVTDAGNNMDVCQATVTVVDNLPPVMTCPANVTATLPPNTTATSMAVTYAAATANDNCDGARPVTCTPDSGSIFSVGATTVTCTASDTSNNPASCSFTVTVLYNFTGFFSPVDNPPVLNTVNAGKAIPVKFSLSGNKGLNIFAVDYPVSGTITCNSEDPPDEVEETLTSGSSSLSYDPATDRYTYVWKTESSWAGTCRQLIVILNDGSTHVANFQFR